MSAEILSESSRRRLLHDFLDLKTTIVTSVSSALNVSTAVTSGVLQASLVADGIDVSSITAPSIVYIEAEVNDTPTVGTTLNNTEMSTPAEDLVIFFDLFYFWAIGLIKFGATITVFVFLFAFICCL